MPQKTGRNIVDSFMFKKTQKVFNYREDTGRKNAEVCKEEEEVIRVIQVKDQDSSQVRKMNGKMPKCTVKERKDAASLMKSKMYFHERSPGGGGE